MAEQIKKNPNDPDADKLNPDIVRLAHRHGFIKGAFNLYLHGDLTWLEALELMVVTVAKEYGVQNNLLIQALREHGPTTTLNLSGAGGLIKALPSSPLPRTVQGDGGDGASSSEPGKDGDDPELDNPRVRGGGDQVLLKRGDVPKRTTG